jgi:CDP-glycerol glycerophosphotransferase (TagB/SpsB family)
MGALSDGPPSFAERRPTVLYNPHFERSLSSWQGMGRQVLEFFRASRDYNLIFAPHVVLYQRGLRHGARPLGRYRHRPNMLIDTGSLAGIDMTYTLAADIYLGDVSSQVYEFLWRPRPCLFLDAHGVDGWAQDPNYRFWHTGQVLRDPADLAPALARADRLQPDYAEAQRQLFAETFDVQAVPASIRAADAIAEFYGLPVAAGDGLRHAGE